MKKFTVFCLAIFIIHYDCKSLNKRQFICNNNACENSSVHQNVIVSDSFPMKPPKRPKNVQKPEQQQISSQQTAVNQQQLLPVQEQVPLQQSPLQAAVNQQQIIPVQEQVPVQQPSLQSTVNQKQKHEQQQAVDASDFDDFDDFENQKSTDTSNSQTTAQIPMQQPLNTLNTNFQKKPEQQQQQPQQTPPAISLQNQQLSSTTDQINQQLQIIREKQKQLKNQLQLLSANTDSTLSQNADESFSGVQNTQQEQQQQINVPKLKPRPNFISTKKSSDSNASAGSNRFQKVSSVDPLSEMSNVRSSSGSAVVTCNDSSCDHATQILFG